MNRGYAYLVLAALSYASMGALIKALSVSFEPFWQTFLRLGVSFAITFGLVLLTKKSLWLKHRRDYLLMLFMGVVGYGLQIMLFTLSLYHTTIGNAIFVFSSYPIITALVAHFVLKERITRRLRVAMILLACVLYLLFDPHDIGKYLLGNSFALAAGTTFAFYIICSRILSKRGNAPETITLWSVGLAVLTSGLAAAVFEQPPASIDGKAVLCLLVFGVLNAAAFNLVNKGFVTVQAGVGTMILLLEPVIASLLGLALFREIPTSTFIIGAIVMIIAIYIETFRLDNPVARPRASRVTDRSNRRIDASGQ